MEVMGAWREHYDRAAFIDMGVGDPSAVVISDEYSELRKVLQKNLAKKLLDGFSWHHGDYRLGEMPAEVDIASPVDPLQEDAA